MTRSEFQPGPAQDHYHDTLGVNDSIGDDGRPLSVVVDDDGITRVSVTSPGTPDDYLAWQSGAAQLSIYTKDWDDEGSAFSVVSFVDTGSPHTVAEISTGGEFFVRPTGEHERPILEVRDHDNNKVFTVDADGTVHIKTGTSIVADL